MFENSRILIVDDEEPLRQTFEVFLSRAGCPDVQGAGSVAAALELVRQAPFDVIVSDILLGDATGIELLRQVRTEGLYCPVIMVTGYPSIETAAEAVRLGAFDYLPKPVKKDALLAVVDRALARERQRRQEETAIARKSEIAERQQRLLQSLPAIVITVDPSLRIIDMNEMALAWCRQWLPQFGRGKLLAAGGTPLCRALTSDCQHVLLTGEPVAEHRLEWNRDSQGNGVLSIQASRVANPEGAGGVLLTLRDLSRSHGGGVRPALDRLHGLVGKSPAMQDLYGLIENAGAVETTVLIRGESGTGKGLVAQALHRESPRAARPFVHVDCASISEEVLESELFGHRRGAFTGADRDRAGRILGADGGSLFLDEIGEISTKMQLRLLRFLQSRVFYPVGGDQPVQVDVRVIAATNADLEKKVAEGSFREDLYYRLRVVEITTPPLRDRIGDLPLLVAHFRQRWSGRNGKDAAALTDRAMECLCNHPWPGNVRELEHVLERALVYCRDGMVRREHLPAEMVAQTARDVAPVAVLAAPAVEDSVDDVERLVFALRKAGGNKAKAARLLGVDRSTVYRKMQMYAIDADKVVDLPAVL
ncbi:MAG: sigma-54 dependent transcriptional regulator [Thermodesulfobacteriota bacterium]